MIKSISAVWLPVDDLSRASDFYGNTLGLTVTEQDGDWAEIELDGQRIGLNAKPSESSGGDGGALVAFSPDGELEDEVARLKEAGVEFTGEISEHSWGRIAPFKDPDGNDLQLYAPPA